MVVDTFDKINNGGHVLLIFGYDDNAQTFEIKNSQALPGFGTMRYANDPQFDIQYNSMFYITAVQPVQTQWAAMWVGRWETDHDGWRGTLVIRRFIDISANDVHPGPGQPHQPRHLVRRRMAGMLDVVGHFVDGGRGLHCNIGDQPFELYLHTSDPYRAGGRTFWNNTPFGVVMSRGTATGAGSGFDRSETIGLWDTVARRLARPAADRRRAVATCRRRTPWHAAPGSTPAPTPHASTPTSTSAATTATSISSCWRTRARTGCSAA